MKISSLAAQYFYQHRKLFLPGIGTFSLDEAITIPDKDDKNFRDFLQYIQFKQSNVTTPDDGLIDYIRLHTGKIKPLAVSDLETYVADGKLLLNIGKPFHVEGIGTLLKTREGLYEFTPGEPLLERLEAVQPIKDREKPAQKKSVFDEDYYPHETKSASRPLLIIGGIVLGLAVVIWGGYSLYNSNVETTTAAAADPEQQATDTTASAQQDSLSAQQSTQPAVINPGYKYILETTASKRRALRRHKQVNELSPRIDMETNADSTLFNIYVVLPTEASDTIRVKDSLNAWYYGTRPVKVRIEH